MKGSDYETARRLAAGHTRDGKAVLFTCTRTICLETAEILEYNFAQIGIALEVFKCGRHCWNYDFDCGDRFELEFGGWVADYADPASFLEPPEPRSPPVYDGRPMACNSSRTYAKRFADADSRPPRERLRALGALEIETMRDEPAVVPLNVINVRTFVSERTRNVIHSPVFGLDLAALRVR